MNRFEEGGQGQQKIGGGEIVQAGKEDNGLQVLDGDPEQPRSLEGMTMNITQGVVLGALVEAWRSPRPSNAVEKTAGAFAQHETPGSGGGDPIRTEVFTSPAG